MGHPLVGARFSYLDSVHQRICGHDVVSVEPQDTGKT